MVNTFKTKLIYNRNCPSQYLNMLICCDCTFWDGTFMMSRKYRQPVGLYLLAFCIGKLHSIEQPGKYLYFFTKENIVNRFVFMLTSEVNSYSPWGANDADGSDC